MVAFGGVQLLHLSRDGFDALTAFVAHWVAVGYLLGVPTFVDGSRHFRDELVHIGLLACEFLGDAEGDPGRVPRQSFRGFQLDVLAGGERASVVAQLH